MSNAIEKENLAETLVRELKQPVEIASGNNGSIKRIALPEGWKMTEFDDEKFQVFPRRKIARVSLDDSGSFIDYLKRHGSLANCTVWCAADYKNKSLSFVSIINDHGEEVTQADWRDHRAFFTPERSEEWHRWNRFDKEHMSQAEFAMFIEDNMKDIASVPNSPTGAQMLEMALDFEVSQNMRFKSAMRLQSGGVEMQFIESDTDQTITKMQMFDRFSLGLPVFWNSDAYQLDARLRYRTRDGKLTFWYELIRADKVFEAAAQTLITQIKEKTGLSFFFGSAFQ